MKKFFIALITTIFLGGCASGVIKTNRSDEIKSIEIRALTQHGFEYTNLVGMSFLGILGAGLDGKIDKESNESIGSFLTKTVSQESLLKSFESGAKPALSRLYPNAAITLSIPAGGNQSKAFNEWFSKDSGAAFYNGGPGLLVLEVGYRLEAVRKIQGLDADGWLGIKIVDASSGKVIGKTLDNSLSTMSGVRILKPGQEANREEFSKESNRGFQELVGKLANRAMAKVAD
jgi:hypothetical protein